MSKPANKLAVAAEIEKDDEHDCGHDHGKAPSLDQAAFLSLVYRTFRENQELRTAYDILLQQTMRALLRCLEERDPYTYGHSMRVMEYAMMIGRGASLKQSEIKNLEVVASFHDLGKIGIGDCVLLKPGRLDPQEEKLMQQHPVKSAEILSLIDAFKSAVPGVLHHHERMDGKGYPDGLAGEEIPLTSRIMLVADTFDAMTSTRPYRKALPVEVAYAELEKYAGTQFDADYVKIFLREHQKLMGATQQLQPKKIKKAA